MSYLDDNNYVNVNDNNYVNVNDNVNENVNENKCIGVIQDDLTNCFNYGCCENGIECISNKDCISNYCNLTENICVENICEIGKYKNNIDSMCIDCTQIDNINDNINIKCSNSLDSIVVNELDNIEICKNNMIYNEFNSDIKSSCNSINDALLLREEIANKLFIEKINKNTELSNELKNMLIYYNNYYYDIPLRDNSGEASIESINKIRKELITDDNEIIINTNNIIDYITGNNVIDDTIQNNLFIPVDFNLSGTLDEEKIKNIINIISYNIVIYERLLEDLDFIEYYANLCEDKSDDSSFYDEYLNEGYPKITFHNFHIDVISSEKIEFNRGIITTRYSKLIENFENFLLIDIIKNKYNTYTLDKQNLENDIINTDKYNNKILIKIKELYIKRKNKNTLEKDIIKNIYKTISLNNFGEKIIEAASETKEMRLKNIVNKNKYNYQQLINSILNNKSFNRIIRSKVSSLQYNIDNIPSNMSSNLLNKFKEKYINKNNVKIKELLKCMTKNECLKKISLLNSMAYESVMNNQINDCTDKDNKILPINPIDMTDCSFTTAYYIDDNSLGDLSPKIAFNNGKGHVTDKDIRNIQSCSVPSDTNICNTASQIFKDSIIGKNTCIYPCPCENCNDPRDEGCIDGLPDTCDFNSLSDITTYLSQNESIDTNIDYINISKLNKLKKKATQILYSSQIKKGKELAMEGTCLNTVNNSKIININLDKNKTEEEKCNSLKKNDTIIGNYIKSDLNKKYNGANKLIEELSETQCTGPMGLGDKNCGICSNYNNNDYNIISKIESDEDFFTGGQFCSSIGSQGNCINDAICELNPNSCEDPRKNNEKLKILNKSRYCPLAEFKFNNSNKLSNNVQEEYKSEYNIIRDEEPGEVCSLEFELDLPFAYTEADNLKNKILDEPIINQGYSETDSNHIQCINLYSPETWEYQTDFIKNNNFSTKEDYVRRCAEECEKNNECHGFSLYNDKESKGKCCLKKETNDLLKSIPNSNYYKFHRTKIGQKTDIIKSHDGSWNINKKNPNNLENNKATWRLSTISLENLEFEEIQKSCMTDCFESNDCIGYTVTNKDGHPDTYKSTLNSCIIYTDNLEGPYSAEIINNNIGKSFIKKSHYGGDGFVANGERIRIDEKAKYCRFVRNKIYGGANRTDQNYKEEMQNGFWNCQSKCCGGCTENQNTSHKYNIDDPVDTDILNYCDNYAGWIDNECNDVYHELEDNSPNHNSPNHNSPNHNSPNHNSPITVVDKKEKGFQCKTNNDCLDNNCNYDNIQFCSDKLYCESYKNPVPCCTSIVNNTSSPREVKVCQ